MVGSQSAPIGTPPQKQICETAQYLAAVYGWGPASVLKHKRQHAEGDHRVGTAAGKAQYRLQRVERARPDVAEDHPQRREAERR